MVMTREDRIELLKKAREAKALKQQERKAEKEANPPVKGRPKKPVEEKRTLDIVDDVLQEKDVLEDVKKVPVKKPPVKKEPLKDDDVEVVEKEIIEKVKKPKRRVLRRIIKQEYESDDTEEEYEEVVIPATRVKKPVQIQKKEHIETPKQIPKQYNNPFFNY
jgi:hypothetical protein